MIDLKFIPFSMYAEGFVNDEDANTLEKYINDDISDVKYNPISNEYHNFLTTSPIHSSPDDGISWDKYKNIFTPYIQSFICSITDNVESLDLCLYFNLCKKNSFISPHYDDDDDNKTSFMMLYCPKNYNNSHPYTTYLTSEKYYRTFSKYEKLPLSGSLAIDLYHERGKFFIVPGNLLHWVTTVSDSIDRVTLMVQITPEFKL